MNKLLTFFALTIIGLLAYSSGSNERMLKRIENDAYNNPTEQELVNYMDEFIADAAKFAIHLDPKEYNISFTDKSYGRVMGISWEMNNDEKVIINIMKSKWDVANADKRKYLMYHELGHDLLNLPHESTPIMKALLSNTIKKERLDREIKQMFEYYNAIHSRPERG